MEKGCEIPRRRLPPVGKCDGKLQQFTVIWNGADRHLGLAVATNDLGVADSVNPGDEVTFSGPMVRPTIRSSTFGVVRAVDLPRVVLR